MSLKTMLLHLLNSRKSNPLVSVIKRAIRRILSLTARLLPTYAPGVPRVSIIIPCYNYGKYLSECVESSINQTYPNLEIIIVDDGSTDNTADVAKFLIRQYPKKIRYYKKENSGGPALPRNFGVQKAIGEFIICLDADDKLHRLYVELCLQALRDNPSASIAYTAIQCFGDHSQIWPVRNYSFQELLYSDFIPAGSMYKRSVWEEVGGYKLDVGTMDDWNFWIEAGKLGYYGIPIKQELFYYRVHPGGLHETQTVVNYPLLWKKMVLANRDVYDPEEVKKAQLS